MPTFHPAYLLRDPSKKRETWEDLKKVRDYLDSQRSSPVTGSESIRVNLCNPWQNLLTERSSRRNFGKRYAEVAVPLHVFQTFTYRLTTEQSLEAQVGARLMVPLGTKSCNWLISSDLSDEIPEELNDVEIKDAQDLVDSAPVCTPEILQLARWVAEYYACSARRSNQGCFTSRRKQSNLFSQTQNATICSTG